MPRSLIDVPPGVDKRIGEQPKGCRVRVSVEEPGFSDARIQLKFPHGEVDNVVIGPGGHYEFILKAHIENQVILEALPREGDPEDPDLEGGAW